MDFCISIAGVNVGIHSLYQEVFELCKDYLCGGAEDFSVAVTAEDIDYERRKYLREAMAEHRMPTIFPDPYLETLAAYRKIAVGMLDYDAFLMHGAVIGVGDEAYLFTAPSGVGKTTHIRLWLENIPGAFVVNGDKPILRLSEGGVIACGTPWSGKEGMNRNVNLPLKAIVFLHRGTENTIESVPFAHVYPQMIQQIYRPTQAIALNKTLSLMKQTVGQVDLYDLRCNMEPQAARVAYYGIRKGGQ